MVILNKEIQNSIILKIYKKIIDNRLCLVNKQIANILFDYCEDCMKMPSLPQGAFAACKIRSYSNKDMKIARIQTNDKKDTKNYTNSKKLMEYTPVKYNSKLMNSIWGLYNRYSPHNIKGNDDVIFEQSSYLQQPLAVASYAIEQNIIMAIEAGNEWTFPERRNN